MTPQFLGSLGTQFLGSRLPSFWGVTSFWVPSFWGVLPLGVPNFWGVSLPLDPFRDSQPVGVGERPDRLPLKGEPSVGPQPFRGTVSTVRTDRRFLPHGLPLRVGVRQIGSGVVPIDHEDPEGGTRHFHACQSANVLELQASACCGLFGHRERSSQLVGIGISEVMTSHSVSRSSSSGVMMYSLGRAVPSVSRRLTITTTWFSASHATDRRTVFGSIWVSAAISRIAARAVSPSLAREARNRSTARSRCFRAGCASTRAFSASWAVIVAVIGGPFWCRGGVLG